MAELVPSGIADPAGDGQRPRVPDPVRERRIKALRCTEPLHDLQANRGRREGWEPYDFYDLGLAAIDVVVDHMALDSGISLMDLRGALGPEALRFVPDASEAEIRDVLTELIETLIRPNVAEYTSAIDEVRRRWDFSLLTEHEDADGQIYLRATREAINVLIGGLNTDVESAQVAAEATLEHLIRRKRLDDAARPAREARILSVQYATEVTQLIEETRRDIRRAGWRGDAPARLAAMRDHLMERMGTEERILEAMQEQRDSAPDDRDDLRRSAAALVETVDDCFTRHQVLHTKILEATRTFTEEQDRQVFGRLPVMGRIDLTDEVLTPVMRSPAGRVTTLLTTFAEALLLFGPGPQAKSLTPVIQPRLGSFIAALLRKPPPREVLGDELEEVEWAEPAADPLAFDQEAWAAAEAAMAFEGNEHLSVLLDRAFAAGGRDAADLVRLRALLATAPDLDAVRPGTVGVLAAGRDGRAFAAAGFTGDDLLVGHLEADPAGFAAMLAERAQRTGRTVRGTQLAMLALEAEAGA